MKLSPLVEIMANNEECVILKVKENKRMDLITLGCFDGDETLLRITKGGTHTATIFRGDNHFSWSWGEGGTTFVSDKIAKCGRMIQSCVEEEFGIYIGKNRTNIQKTLHIKTVEDKANMEHTLRILYWPKKEYAKCNIHKDNEHFKWFDNVREAREYVSTHYTIQSQNTTTAVTGCIVEEYQVVS